MLLSRLQRATQKQAASTLSRSRAMRLASILLALALGASFLSVAAFADTPMPGDEKPPIENKVTLTVKGVNTSYDTYAHTPSVTAVDADQHPLVIEYSADNENWSTDVGTVAVAHVKDSKTVWVRVSSPDYYEGFIVKSAEITITPSEMTLISGDLEKKYDGTPLVNGLNPVYGKGFIGIYEGAYYHFTGSQTAPGESPNEFTYQLNDRTHAEDYLIKTEFGTLKVTDRDDKFQIIVRARSDRFVYDGTKKTVSGFETLSFEVNGQQFTVSGLEASASAVEAGDYPVTVTGDAVVSDSDGNDVTSQFDVIVVNGNLSIVDSNLGAPAGSTGSGDSGIPSSEGSLAAPADAPAKAALAETAAQPALTLAKTNDSGMLCATGFFGVAMAACAVAAVAGRNARKSE